MNASTPARATTATPAHRTRSAGAQDDGDLPVTVTIFIGNKTIRDGTPSFEDLGHNADGTGIDHFFDAHGEALFGVLCTAVPDHPFCEGPPV